MNEQTWKWVRIASRVGAVIALLGLLRWCNHNGEALNQTANARTEVLQALAVSGIQHNSSDSPEEIFAQLSDRDKGRLLYESVESASLKAIKWMVSHGADPTSVGVIDDLNLLQLAARSADKDKLVYFLDKGFEASVRTRDGRTLLHLAARGSLDKTTLSWLLQQGVAIDDVDQAGQTPLHGASYASTRVLLDAGASIDAVDAKMRTPLHQAVLNNAPEVVDELISRGASVFAVDKEGRTPLHLAAQRRSEPMVNALLAAGAMKSTRDVYNMTPRDLAEKSVEYNGYPSLLNKL